MKFILSLLFSLCACATVFSQYTTQQLTEEAYLKIDKQIWDDYERSMAEVSECYSQHPEKKDSLMQVQKAILDLSSRLNQEAAIAYVSVPSGFQRVFMLRGDIPKDTLSAILNRLPQAMQDSPYGRSLRQHINTKQIAEGDPFFDFAGSCPDGSPFVLSSLKGKQILLLYGGLGCMGESGRDYLSSLYGRTTRDNLEIVVFWPCSSKESLQEIREAYPGDSYIFTSDFLEDHSPMKITYGAQATPTCFLIDRDGTVILKSVGLRPSGLDAFIK